MNTPLSISAQHAVECGVVGAAWQADITATAFTSGDHTLRVDVVLLRLMPGPKEQWRLWFDSCVAHQLLPMGAPGNAHLPRPVKQFAFAPPPSVIYEIVDSDWLPTCQPVGGAPGKLRHYVIIDNAQNLALHVAATNINGQRAAVAEAPEPAGQLALASAGERE